MQEEYSKPRPVGRRLTKARIETCRLAQNTPVDGRVGRGDLAVLAQNLPCTKLINGSESHLLVTLINTAPKECFEAGGHPVVFKSNQQIGFEIDRSPGRVSRLLSRLFDAGLLAMQDSGNYKRYPVRNEEGAIVSACGIDLRVLIARYDELVQLVQKAREEKRRSTAAIRRYRGLVRHIRAALAAADDLIDRQRKTIERRLETVLRAVGTISQAPSAMLEKAALLLQWLLERLFGLQKHREEAAQESDETVNQTCPHVENDMQRQNTTRHQIVKSNEMRSSANAEQPNSNEAGYASQNLALENKGVGRATANNPPTRVPAALQDVLSAFPALGMLPETPKSWRDLVRLSGHLCAMLGISEHARAAAFEAMGEQNAAVAIALTWERTDRGEVSSPGGFLRALTSRALTGELHLSRSVHALIKRALTGDQSRESVASPGTVQNGAGGDLHVSEALLRSLGNRKW